MHVDALSGARRAMTLSDEPTRASAGVLPRRDAPPLDPALAARMIEAADAMTSLQALQALARDAQLRLGEAGVVARKGEVEAAREKIKEAVEQARREAEAKAESDGWTGALQSVAGVATTIAAAAAVVATGGASLPLLIGLAGTLISMGSKQIAGAVGGDERLEAALRYGGLAASLTGGALHLTGQAAGAASTLATAARATKAGATAVAGASTAAAGYTTRQAGLHEARGQRARADEVEARAQQQQAMRQLDALIEALGEVDRSFTKARAALRGAAESQAASSLALVAGGVRA